MNELSIRIKIGEREYPMRVKAEEEELLRRAGKLVNERIKHYRERYGITDPQDLLAMVAFDGLVERLRQQDNVSGDTADLAGRLEALDIVVGEALEGGK